ncbi:MAG TPA: tetratricopeptide repeat protein [Trebonia sp.]|jgi:DNA-binding SARP family transcriptional activator/tetratricopeptide (TPR) repeat protein|nr:tetratricopeptide repeat protein [Trebonia sp.]
MDDMDFRLLGPVAVFRDGRPVPLGRGTLLDLLATLMVSPNQVITVSTLTETVWHDRTPRHPQAALHSVVARLRQLIGGAFIETLPMGYRFRADAGSVDLLKHEQLVEVAEQEKPAEDALRLLSDAIGLWRGAPLENVGSTVLLNKAVPRLTQLYLDTCEKWARLCLRTGRHDAVVSRLTTLVDEHPFRERMAGQLMLGLYHSGRQADAIAAYESLRHGLSEEMGIDPGQDLQELHLKILRADPSIQGGPHQASLIAPATAVPPATTEPVLVKARGLSTADNGSTGVPHQLPTDTRMFTGRQTELMHLLELAERADGGPDPGTVVISAIDGMAGIGKTALAVHAAHLVADRFGDGQLFIDLHGYTQGYPPRTPDQVLEKFLRTLGVPPQQIPGDTEERAALYRDRLAGTHTLIVLDNAADETQVRPLIPGEAQCLVLVTSRRKLKALDDAHGMALDVLPGREAVGLFRRITGSERAAADDPAVAEITGLCACLPLAIRIGAALIRNRPAWTPGHLAAKLRTDRARLDAFSDGDRDLAALFDLSSQALNDGQRRLYRYVGLISSPEVDAYAAGALLATDPAVAERLLQELVDHNLLQEFTAGRYRMHDLIRAHARALATPEPEREAKIDRLFRYYEHTADRADIRTARYSRPGPADRAPAHAPELPDAAAARTWLRTERANLTACLQLAIDSGQDEHVVALSRGLSGLLCADGPWPQAAVTHAAAAAAAARLGDRPGQAYAMTELGSLRRLTGDYQDADVSLRMALDLYRSVNDESGQARALTELGAVERLSGNCRGAEVSLRMALDLYRSVNDESGQARALTELATVRYVSGDYQGADTRLQMALDLYRSVGNESGQAFCLTELAEIQQLTGDYHVAARSGKAALDICRQLDDRLGQANALSVVGKVQRMTQDYDAAAQHQEAALDLYRELGDRLGQANTRTLLAEVRGLAGEYERAARDLEESISTYQEMGNPGNQATAMNHYAAVIAAAGDPTRATTIYRDALHLAREVQQPDEEAIALHGIGENHLRTGEFRDGIRCLRQALEIYRRLGMPTAEHLAARMAQIKPPGKRPGPRAAV